MGFFRSLFAQPPPDPGDHSIDLTSADARRSQLHRFAEASDELSVFYTRIDRTSMIPWCDKLANDARAFLSGGFEDAQIKKLALSIPTAAPYYGNNPKAVDNGWHEDSLQREERALLDALQEVAAELRAIDAPAAEVIIRPWREGHTGKAVVYADGVVFTSEDNAPGEPSIEDIKVASRPGPPEAVMGIAPDGSCDVYSLSYDESWVAARLREHHPALHLGPPQG